MASLPAENTSIRVSAEVHHPQEDEKEDATRQEKKNALYGRVKHSYKGKNSEGNRFIKNEDL